MKSFTSFLYLFIFSILFTQAQPAIESSGIYGGSNIDWPTCFVKTYDGYVVAGISSSNDGDVSGNHGGRDWWIVRLNNEMEIVWQKSLGGSEWEDPSSIIQCSDGGFTIVGNTESNDGDVSGNHGFLDLWMVHLDSQGNIIWQKCHGGSNLEYGRDIELLSDGSYIIAGASKSTVINGVPTGNHGEIDLWILKTDSVGNIIWHKSYGGWNDEHAFDIDQTSDGGFIVSGVTYSNDGNVTGFHGFKDCWIVKLDSLGDLQWQKCFGGTEEEQAYDIEITADGGYIFAGRTKSIDGDISFNHGDFDGWLVKMDSVGNLEWERCMGGSERESLNTVKQTQDLDYFVSGHTESVDGDILFNHGNSDGWIFKIDEQQSISWQLSLGGSNSDGTSFFVDNNNDQYDIACYSYSDDGDLGFNNGTCDYWIIETSCLSGSLSIEISDTIYSDSTFLSAIGDFTEYLWNTGDTTQSITITSGGLYSVFAYTSDGCYKYAEIIAPDPIQPPFNGLEICMVTYDDSSAFNAIIYEPIHNVGIDTILFYIYDTLSNDYEWIGANHIDEEGIYYDDGASPDLFSYKYKLAIQDTFGNISDFSLFHETMYLSAIINPVNEIVLSWNPYIGFEYDEFEVHRSVDGGAYELIASTEDTSYSDQTASTGQVVYQVRVEKDTSCNPGNIVFSHAASNPVVIPYVGLPENSIHALKIYPNPFEDRLIISRTFAHGALHLEIFDIYNRLLGQYSMNRGEQNMSISTAELSSGLYFIRINQTEIRRVIKQ